MNDNSLGNSFDNGNVGNDNTYRATTNLNMAIENPDVNINSIMGVNIKNINTNNSQSNVNYNQGQNNLEQGFINNDINTQVYNNSQNFINNSTFSQNIENVNNNTNQYQAQFNSSVDVNNNTNQYQAQFIIGATNNSNINTNMNFVSDYSSSSTDNEDANVRYEPTLKTKKKPSSWLEIAKEVKAMFVIVIILSLFIFGMPYIYDFFRNMN